MGRQRYPMRAGRLKPRSRALDRAPPPGRFRPVTTASPSARLRLEAARPGVRTARPRRRLARRASDRDRARAGRAPGAPRSTTRTSTSSTHAPSPRDTRCASRPASRSPAARRACSGRRCSRRSGCSAAAARPSCGRRGRCRSLALGGLAWEAARLTERLAGRAAAVGAGAMVLAFGGLHVVRGERDGGRAVRVGHRARDAPGRRVGGGRSPTHARRGARAELVALAWMAALFRPEGALWRSSSRATLAAFPREPAWRERALGASRGRGGARAAAAALALTGSRAQQHGGREAPAGQPLLRGARARRRVVRAGAPARRRPAQRGARWSRRSSCPAAAAPVAMAGLGAIALLGWRDKLAVAGGRACCSSR